MIFVIGATGNVGRNVVSGLLERNAPVRALSRQPDAAGLPEGVEVVDGAVAVRVLAEDGHAGERYVLTGPEALTQIEQVRAIGDAIGRAIRWEELSREEAEQELDGRIPDTALDTWSSFVETPEVVTSTV